MDLSTPRAGRHRYLAPFVVALLSAPSALAQTSSPKTFHTSPDPTPKVQAQKSSTVKTGVQTTFTKNATGGLSSPSPAAALFTNATPITITDCPNPCPASGQAASIYPAPIVVSGEVGVVQRVSVTINGFSHAFPADVDFLLVSPSGRRAPLRQRS